MTCPRRHRIQVLRPRLQGADFWFPGMWQPTPDLPSFVQETCPVRILDDKLPHDKRHEITTDFSFFEKTIILYKDAHCGSQEKCKRARLAVSCQPQQVPRPVISSVPFRAINPPVPTLTGVVSNYGATETRWLTETLIWEEKDFSSKWWK